MTKLNIQEPSADQCDEKAKVLATEEFIGYAAWYPQMGGYHGKCVIVFSKYEPECFDCYIWHDSNFPFRDDYPIIMHHCDAEQFIEFGKLVLEKQELERK